MRHALLFMMLIPATLSAQQLDTRAPLGPNIVVAARGEATVTPDRATLHIAVETRSSNAAAAASQNAQIQQRVIAAVRALGIANEQISTTSYNISPEYRYDPNRAPQLIGYRASNTVVVDVRRIDQVGPVIDAAVGAGANVVSSLQFYSSQAESARRDALARAMEIARRDAEVMARAAGGGLGTLLEASVGAYMRPPQPPIPMMAAARDMAETSISPGEQTLVVDVMTRWSFLAN